MAILRTHVSDPPLMAAEPGTTWPTYTRGPQQSLLRPSREKVTQRATSHKGVNPRAVAWVVVLLMMIVETGWSFVCGSSYPPMSAVGPLPTGDKVVLDVTFPPGGMSDVGTRVLLIAIPSGVKVATGMANMGHVLRSRGWTRSLCSPKNKLCAVVGLSPADLHKDYGIPSNSPSVRRIETTIHKLSQPSFMLLLAHK
jgi:hypothetical protein